MSSKERIMDYVDKAYTGLPVEYHKRLAERLIACITDTVNDMDIEEALSNIKYHSEKMKEIYYSDSPPPVSP